MKPSFEKVTVPAGASWTLFHRRLPAFPFEWHYHPEYELTFTLNSLGQRYIGDHIAPYGDGDLALVGPNLPHTWQSARPIDPGAPHVAIVMWFTQRWVEQVLRPLPEFRATCRMLDAATRGLGFSAGDRGGSAHPHPGAAGARPDRAGDRPHRPARDAGAR